MGFSNKDGEASTPRVDGLTPKRAAFVAEYLIDLNATQAAIRAGYSPSTASEQSAVLLGDVRVKEAIEISKAQRLSRVNITADTVLHEMSLLALSRIDHYVVTDEGQVTLAEGAPEGAMAAIQSIHRKTKIFRDREGCETHREYDVTIKLWEKPQPIRLMGRHVGLFADRVEHTGPKGGPIELTNVPLSELLERHKALIEIAATGDESTQE